MNDTGFSVLAEGEPDEIDVELLLIGAIDDETQAAAVRAAMAGPLADTAAELEAARADWAANRRPFFNEAAPPAANRRFPWRALVLVAAVLLAVVAVWVTTPDPEDVRSMGGLPVDTWTQRAGQPVGAGNYVAGDRVFLRFRAPSDGYVTVASVHESGAVLLLSRTGAGTPITAGTLFSVDGAVELDDDPGREWLVVMLTETWEQDAAVMTTVGALLPDPEAAARERGQWATEITRGR